MKFNLCPFTSMTVSNLLCTRSVQKWDEFSNFSGYAHSISDPFVLLCWYTRPPHMLTSSAILNFLACVWQIQSLNVFQCAWRLATEESESVLSVRRVMRHLVIHSDSCGCLSPGVKSWLLHHGNEPAHRTLLIRNVLANNNTVFTRLGPLRLFHVSKTEDTHERTEICTIEEIKTSLLEEFKTIPKSAYQKCFEDWKKRWHKFIISKGDCIVFYWRSGDCCPIHCDLFKIYCAPPNLGIIRTWICRLNFVQRPIFSGLRFFNETEI